jgi:predicted PurR-regulated permease PerM
MEQDALAIKHNIVRNWLLGGLLLLATLTVLGVGSTVFIPVFMALFLAVVLRIPVQFFTSLRVPQTLATVLVLVLFCGSVLAISSAIYEPAAQWSTRVPELVNRLEEKIDPIRRALVKAQKSAEQIGKVTDIAPKAPAPQVVVKDEQGALSKVFEQSRILLAQIIATIILTFFLLSTDAPVISDRLLASFGGTGRRLRLSVAECMQQMARYMGIMALINIGVGLLTGMIALVAGLPNPMLWAVAATLFNFVPYLGPVAIAIAIAAVSLLTFDNWWQVWAPVLAFIAVHFFEGEFFTPIILGRMMTLHPVAIVISVLVWGWMWGLAGAFLAVPILLASVVITRKVVIGDAEAAKPEAPKSEDEKAPELREEVSVRVSAISDAAGKRVRHRAF